MNQFKKKRETENDCQFGDYRDVDRENRTNCTNDKLSKLTVSNKLKEVVLNEVGLVFGATCLYPSAMSDEKSVFSKTESVFHSNRI